MIVNYFVTNRLFLPLMPFQQAFEFGILFAMYTKIVN